MAHAVYWGEPQPEDFDALRRWHEMILTHLSNTDASLSEPPADADDEEAQLWSEYNGELVHDAEQLADIAAAGLAVAVSSVVENRLKMLLRLAGCTLGDEAYFGHAKAAWCQMELPSPAVENLAGYAEVQVVRQMANCFKHNAGCFDDKLLKALPGAEADKPKLGGRIDYANHAWDEACDAAHEMLHDAYKQLVGHCEHRDGRRPYW